MGQIIKTLINIFPHSILHKINKHAKHFFRLKKYSVLRCIKNSILTSASLDFEVHLRLKPQVNTQNTSEKGGISF